MGSMYSNNENIIRIMFQTLSYYGIYTSGKVIKKMAKLLKEDVLKFSIDFSHDIVQKDFELNRFEILKLSNTDRKKLDNNKLYRYEYRKKSNMRTLFVVCDSTKRLLVVEAFNENGNKTNGKDSYDRAIRNAISNYIDMKEE